MRIPVLTLLVLLTAPTLAIGQSLELYGSAGPTLIDTGNSLAVGAGVSPHSHVAIVLNFERTHLSSRTSHDGHVVSSFRGGTLLLGTAELRVAAFGRGRVGPYGLVGVAAGVSRLNVNDVFPTHATTEVRAMFFGGGLQVPLNERLTLFADGRIMIGEEGTEGIVAVAPVRAGLAWRF